MPDSIVQKLGFDVGDATSAISRLNTDMKTMAERVQALGQAFSAFNSQASGTSKILSSMAADANKAAEAFERLAKARGSVNNGAGRGGGGGSGGRGGRGVPDHAEVKQHIAALQQTYGPAPAEASDTAQRKYQNAITQAAEFAAKSKQSVSQVAAIGQNLGSSFTGAANTMANRLSSIKQSFANMTKSASQNVNKLTIDFQTFVRIVSTQVIVRALSAIKQGFQDAFDSAIKFQTQVAEIGTISTKDFGGSEGIAKTVKDISDAFNLPLNTSAEGYYETISNQIGNAAKSQEFLAGSAKLAKAGVTDLDQAVNLLSGTLNAYGIDASKTDAIASKYFETVRLGRVRVDDLANTMGRVLPQARQVGVGLDEVLAMITSVTISGVKPAEALTQIRGVINALTKPTDDLQRAFKELGVASAEEGVSVYGLGGLLQKLSSTTDGTQAAFAKLFPNMRGVNGAVIVGKQQIQGYADALSAIKNASGSLINEKATEVLSSDAQKVQGEMNKIKNALTTGLGGALVSTFASMRDWGLGADTLITGTKAITPVLLGAGAALTAYALKLGIGAAANVAFAGSAGLVTKSLLGIGVAVAAGTALADIYNHFYEQPHSDYMAQQQATLALAKDAADKQGAAAQAMYDQIAKAAKNNSAVLNTIYLQNVSNAKAADDKQLAHTRDMLNSIVNAREKLVDKLRQEIGKSYDIQQQSENRVADAQLKREQSLFEMRTKSLSPRYQAFKLRDRTSDLTSRASNLLSTAAGNPQQIQQALNLFQAAEQTAQEFGQKAQESGALQRQAQEAILRVMDKRIEAEQQLQALEQRRQQALTAEKSRQEKILGDVKKAVKTVLDNTGNYNKKEERPFSQKELADRANKRDAALNYLQRTALSSSQFSLADSLGLGKFVSEFRTELSSVAPIKVRLDIANGAKQFQQMLQEGIGDLDTAIPARKLLESVSGKSINNPAEFQSAVTQLDQELARLNESVTAANKHYADVRTANNDIGERSRELSDIYNNHYGVLPGIRNLIPGILELAKKPNITPEEYNRQGAIFKRVREQNSIQIPGLQNRTTLPFSNSRALNLVDEIMAGLEKRTHLQEGAAGNPAVQNMQGVTQRMMQLQNALNQARSTGLNLANSSRSASEGLNNVGSAATAAAEKLGNIQIPQSAPIAAHATGGLIRALNNSRMQHFAGGGQPRGVDRIPAMLAPNEFVVNARSTRNFLPQLQAMNAGMQPNYRSNGGHTTNVGDVTVNVNGANHSPHDIAREVAGHLKRLGRRGVI